MESRGRENEKGEEKFVATSEQAGKEGRQKWRRIRGGAPRDDEAVVTLKQ